MLPLLRQLRGRLGSCKSDRMSFNTAPLDLSSSTTTPFWLPTPPARSLSLNVGLLGALSLSLSANASPFDAPAKALQMIRSTTLNPTRDKRAVQYILLLRLL